MKQVLNKKFLFFVLVFSGLFAGSFAKAICPLCVVAVGAGVGMSRWLGIDDLISSMWIGALLFSLSVWTIDWLKRKNWNFKFYKVIVFFAYYFLTLYPLWQSDVMGHPLNKFFGIDKILLGAIIGTVIFLLATWLHNYIKAKNNGKSFFSYQKIVLPVFSLLIASLILWIII
jgi:cation transport ATPase